MVSISRILLKNRRTVNSLKCWALSTAPVHFFNGKRIFIPGLALRKHVSDENASFNHLYCKIDHHQISPCLNAL